MIHAFLQDKVADTDVHHQTEAVKFTGGDAVIHRRLGLTFRSWDCPE
jgi:hypothetical protein